MEVMEGKWLYVVMVFLAMVMLWAQGQSKKFKSSWARPLVILSTLLIVALAGTQVVRSLTQTGREGDRIRNKEFHYLSSAMQAIGDEIGSSHRGANILVVTAEPNEFNKLQARQDIVINGLNAGLRDRATVGAVVHPKYNAEITDTVEEGMVTAKMIDDLIEANVGHQIVLLMVGLPHDFQDMALWSIEDEETRPKLALSPSSVFELRRAIAGGYIACAVAYKPGYRFDLKGEAPELHADAFAERYLLVTPANVEELAAEHEKLFLIEEEEDDK
jgi:hypothetical protein